MQLPVHIEREPCAPCVLVDGNGPGAVLELSHWPGNRTPPALRHELSTGIALAFGRLAADERERLAAGATRLVNNHYDTDGTLALFAVRHPERALPRAEVLLAAAAAGDFFRWPDDRALCIDAVVGGLAHSPDSPLAGEWANSTEEERWTRCTAYLFDALPALLDGDLVPWRALWDPVLERARADRRRLGTLERSDDARRDLTLWSGDGQGPDPGRHALFGATEADRVLVITEEADGTRARLVLSTLSWFEPVRDGRLARPDLARLAARFDELEGTTPEDAHAWRAQDSAGASPELWFGRAASALFAEHNDALAPSRLAPAVLRAEIERALEPEP